MQNTKEKNIIVQKAEDSKQGPDLRSTSRAHLLNVNFQSAITLKLRVGARSPLVLWRYHRAGGGARSLKQRGPKAGGFTSLFSP